MATPIAFVAAKAALQAKMTGVTLALPMTRLGLGLLHAELLPVVPPFSVHKFHPLEGGLATLEAYPRPYSNG